MSDPFCLLLAFGSKPKVLYAGKSKQTALPSEGGCILLPGVGDDHSISAPRLRSLSCAQLSQWGSTLPLESMNIQKPYPHLSVSARASGSLTVEKYGTLA